MEKSAAAALALRPKSLQLRARRAGAAAQWGQHRVRRAGPAASIAATTVAKQP
ncbi:hypothetical protein [Paenibacillus sp. YYML68]|uniref:hypothetical protein n=1 Tax=Paenibacillus sp. YYML68 TaxID=2909250 RepID=UPI00248FE897|nr:hypothetical protein [Paenibacillus sp. YYML68]